MGRREGPVAGVASRPDAGVCRLERAGERGERARLEHHPDAAPLGQLVGVAEQAEPRDVGHRARRCRAERVGRVRVERPHERDRLVVLLARRPSLAVGGHDERRPQRLRQEQHVAGSRAALGPDRVGARDADDGEPVLRLLVADRVTAREDRAGRAHLGGGGRKDRGDRLRRELLGEGGDGQGQQRRPAHREDVVEGVRRRDGAVVVRVVDERREEVHREDESAVVVQAVHGRVVGRIEPDQQVLGLDRDEPAEELVEPRRRVLRSAAAADRELRQPRGGDLHASH